MFNKHDFHEEGCGCGTNDWPLENRIAALEKKEKIMEAKLEFLRKVKENLKKETKEK